MYIWGYQTPVLIPSGQKKTSFLVKLFHFQGTNVHLGVPNSSFYPQFVRLGKKNFIFSEIFPFLGNKCTFGGTKKNFIFSELFPFLGNKCTQTQFHFYEFFTQMYIWGTKLQFLSPICTIGSKKTSVLVKFFHFQGTNVHLGVPNSSFYPHRSKKTSFLVKFFHFQGTNVHLGVPNSSFYPQFVRLGKKNLIFSEIFPFLGNKCTFGGTKLQFLSPICMIG